MQNWRDSARCLDMDTNLFFDSYEEDKVLAATMDSLCKECPVRRHCFAVGVSNKEWGVWGGVYLRDGTIDKEFNSHKTKSDWFDVWQSLTMETE